MKIKKFIVSLILITISINSYSQQNPPGINWKSIDTGVYTIIFPEEITTAGIKMADLMRHYEKYNYSSLKTKPRNIPIVLINQNAEANGFVSVAPFYSHWYTTPSSFDGLEWFRGLAIHEGRHMVQMNKLKDGAGKGAWRVLAGENGTAVFEFIYIPQWFMEGDAVVMETALTKGGRGRLPYFTLWQRGLELSGERYSYYRNYLGSYDSLYPRNDHYKLGYLLCSYIQRHYGIDVWNRVLENTGKYFIFYTFDRSLEFETGKTITELYDDALNEYNSLWNRQIEGVKITEAEIKSSHRSDRFDSYLFPFPGTEGRLRAISYSRDKKIMLVDIDQDLGISKVMQMPRDAVSGMFMNERTLSAGGEKVLWRESVPDPRWGYRSYIDMKLFDASSGETVKLTDKRRFIASAISPDGSTVAGIEYTPDLKYYLNIFSTDGKEISSDELKGIGHIFDPAVSGDSRYIALSSLSDDGNALLLYDRNSGKHVNLSGYTHNETFRSPVFFGRYLLYVSNYSGIDNIYAVDIDKKKRYQVTSRKLGAYYPSVDYSSSTLLFNDYSVNGYTVASMKLNPADWTPIEKVEKRSVDTIEPIAQQELIYGFDQAYNVPLNDYEVKDYSPLSHSINVYGWIPVFNSTDSEFSVSLMSKDVLHTTDILVSYVHNFNENCAAGNTTLVYSGLYPVISLTGGYGERAVKVDTESAVDPSDYVTWKETIAKGGISFPLDFSRGIHTTSVAFGGNAGYIHITEKTREDYSIYNDMNTDGDLIYNKYYFTFSHFIPGASSAVTPGTGQTLQVSYTHTPYNSEYKGNLFSSSLAFYLPGITETQGLILKGSYEKLDYENYIFPEQQLFPRGYDSVRYENFMKGSIDYAFPMFNLSANIWKLVYFKRINGDLFFDYGVGLTDNVYTYYPSAGFELTAEQNLLSNLYLAVEAGIRYSYCFENDEHKYDFVLKAPVY